MIPLQSDTLLLTNIIVDPNNPRFFDLQGWGEPISEDMYADESVQLSTLQKLKTSQLGRIEDIKNSIRTNGYIPTELIVVKPYPYAEDRFVVIEGNRRIAAIKDIVADTPFSAEHQELQETLGELQVLIYEPTGDQALDEENELILQGIRHISGPKEWGAYQKANLVVRLHDELGIQFDKIDSQIGLGPRITPRYYRAYKALQQMREDDEFGSMAEPGLFTLFEEAIRKPGIQEWLGWNRETGRFTNGRRLSDFYSVIAGDPVEDQEPKITNPRHMRLFGDLLAEGAYTQVNRFMSGEIDIESAHTHAFPPEVVPLSATLRDCEGVLEKMSTEETRNLDAREIELLDRIVELVRRRKRDHEALNSTTND